MPPSRRPHRLAPPATGHFAGYDRLGKYVLDELSSSLEGEGLGYFPLDMIEGNAEPRQWQEVRIYRRGKGIGKERASDGGWGAWSPDLPGCVALGDSFDAGVAEMREAITFHPEGLAEDGEAIPERSGPGIYISAEAAGPTAAR